MTHFQGKLDKNKKYCVCFYTENFSFKQISPISSPLQHTALTKHSLEFDRGFDFDNVKVVDKEANLNQRIIRTIRNYD